MACSLYCAIMSENPWKYMRVVVLIDAPQHGHGCSRRVSVSINDQLDSLTREHGRSVVGACTLDPGANSDESK